MKALTAAFIPIGHVLVHVAPSRDIADTVAVRVRLKPDSSKDTEQGRPYFRATGE